MLTPWNIIHPKSVREATRASAHYREVYTTRSIHSAMFLLCTLNFSGSRNQKHSVVRR